ATPFLEEAYYERWFAWPHVLFTAQVPLLVAVATAAYFISLARRRERAPFLLALGLFALSMAGLGVSVFPDIVPGAVGIHEAASPRSAPPAAGGCACRRGPPLPSAADCPVRSRAGGLYWRRD